MIDKLQLWPWGQKKKDKSPNTDSDRLDRKDSMQGMGGVKDNSLALG